MTRLKRLRLERRLSVREVSQSTGVPVRTIRRLEAGAAQRPTMENIRPLAEFYDITALQPELVLLAIVDDDEAVPA